MLVLDPRNDYLLAAQAELRLKNRTVPFARGKIEAEVRAIRRDVYAALVALHAAAHQFPIEFAFNNNFVYQRSEIFEGGLLLTNYDGDKLFPGSVLYEKSSSVYFSHQRHFLHHLNNATFK
ncbi:MAG: hypothetical protein ACHBNF_07915 [Chromatiales bacterium]